MFQSNVQVGFASLSVLRLVVFGVAVALIAGSFLLFYKTRFGMQVRAVMQNKEMAAAFGIDAARVYMITFALGAGLAGVAGSLFGVLAIVLPNMGANYVVQAFLVVVVGGGTILGSLVASGLTGELQSIFAFMTSDTFARFILYVLIVIFLRFKPKGLFAPAAARR